MDGPESKTPNKDCAGHAKSTLTLLAAPHAGLQLMHQQWQEGEPQQRMHPDCGCHCCSCSTLDGRGTMAKQSSNTQQNGWFYDLGTRLLKLDLQGRGLVSSKCCSAQAT